MPAVTCSVSLSLAEYRIIGFTWETTLGSIRHFSVSVSPEEYRILELFSFYGTVVLALLKGDTAVTRPLHTSCVGEVHLLHTNSIWDLAEVLEEATSQMSSGSTSPDLRDTWHQGRPMSPQW